MDGRTDLTGLCPETRREISKHGPETVISNRENMAKDAGEKAAARFSREAALIRRKFNIK